jgi:hypothetical protein
VSALAATALLAVGCDGRGFMPEPLMGRHLLAPPSNATAAAANFVAVDDPIHLDPSMYPAELLESATYDVVDGLPKDFIWVSFVILIFMVVTTHVLCQTRGSIGLFAWCTKLCLSRGQLRVSVVSEQMQVCR